MEDGVEADPEGCPAKVTVAHKSRHEESCEYRWMRCVYSDSCTRKPCPEEGRKNAISHHQSECPMRPIKCPHVGCTHHPSHSRLEKHVSECRHAIIACRFANCDAEIPRGQVQQHEQAHLAEHLAGEHQARTSLQAKIVALQHSDQQRMLSETQLQLRLSKLESRVAKEEGVQVPRDFGTIQEAVDAASAGETIHIAAGVYSEHLTIRTQLLLKGSEVGTVLQSHLETPVIQLIGGSAVIANMTVKHTGATPQPALSATGGRHVLNSCFFQSIRGPAITTSTNGTQLSIVNSQVTHSPQGGIVASENATVSVDQCEIRCNEFFGASSTSGGVLTIRRSSLYGSKYGVFVTGAASKASIAECDLSGNQEKAVFTGVAVVKENVVQFNNTNSTLTPKEPA